jgi:hypothetical protein
MKQYKLYKGLQRPLIFKIFKGKYIYWALGSIVTGIIVGGVISSLVSSVVGIFAMAAVAVPLLFYTISMQKKGLYTKRTDKLIYIIPPIFKRKHREENF